jgi:glycosyltransferase involved in cell wall biosynthesis
MEMPASQSHHRIALVSGGLGLGGSTTFLINFAGELIRRGIPAEVLSFERENPLADDFDRKNVPVLCLNQRGLIFEDRLKTILENLSRFRPTAVVSTLGATSFEVLRYVPRGILRVAMGQSHDPLVYDGLRHYAPWTDLLAMVSKTMKQTAVNMPEFARLPVAHLPYGVPIGQDAQSTGKDFTQPLRILYLGRLEQEQKRVRLFPEILRRLCESRLPFHWTIAGAGSERDFLEANMKTALPNQTISFAGPLRYADVPSVLKQHDIYLLASDYEGLPLSLLEAMGNGLVPVVSDLESGIREVVDATVGVLVPIGDVSAYAQAVTHLHQHREELAAKSSAARARVQREFSVAAMTDRWLAVLPSKRTAVDAWPNRWPIQGVLNSRSPLYFSRPMRILRRAAACIRNWKEAPGDYGRVRKQ